MLTGMPSTVTARSVPWSRLKPRRKYWLALPSPLCWVTIRPGTTSSASAGRENGRALTSSPLTFFSLDDATGAAAAGEAFTGAALPVGARFWIGLRLDRPPLSTPRLGLERASGRSRGASTTTSGSGVGFVSWADAPGAITAPPINQIAANPYEDRYMAPP